MEFNSELLRHLESKNVGDSRRFEDDVAALVLIAARIRREWGESPADLTSVSDAFLRRWQQEFRELIDVLRVNLKPFEVK